MAEQRYYIRVRGKVLGPYDLQYLKRERERGRLSSFHEISADQVSWAPASSVAELFPPVVKPQQPVVAAVTAEPPKPRSVPQETVVSVEPVEAEWHYMNAREVQVGPISQQQLLELLQRGEISAQTQVWSKSLKDWQTLESVPGLQDGAAGCPPGSPGQKSSQSIGSRKTRSGISSKVGRDGKHSTWAYALRFVSRLALELMPGRVLVSAIFWLGGIGGISGILLGVQALRRSRETGLMKDAGRRRLIVTALVVGLAVVIILIPIVYFVWLRTPQFTEEEIYARYRRRVYLLQTERGRRTAGILLVNNETHGLIATNLSVVEDQLQVSREARRNYGALTEIKVDAGNEDWVATKSARVAAIHREKDLAFVVLDLEKATPDEVPVISRQRFRAVGRAVALGFLDEGNKVIRESFPIAGGVEGMISIRGGSLFPGSPLFLERGGALAGIITSGAEHRQEMGGQRMQGLAPGLPAFPGAEHSRNAAAEPAEELIAFLKFDRTNEWVWRESQKGRVLQLVKKVPLID